MLLVAPVDSGSQDGVFGENSPELLKDALDET